MTQLKTPQTPSQLTQVKGHRSCRRTYAAAAQRSHLTQPHPTLATSDAAKQAAASRCTTDTCGSQSISKAARNAEGLLTEALLFGYLAAKRLQLVKPKHSLRQPGMQEAHSLSYQWASRLLEIS
jgi:hypothetical protein